LKVFIVYAHPSDTSFTCSARDSFIRGLVDAGHEYILSDLYRMGFKTDMTEAEYERESNYNCDSPIPDDVMKEQEKINSSDAIVFIYPVFWTEAPAKLVGWFDRVWTYGFAYGERQMKQLHKGLVLCTAGHSIKHLCDYKHLEAMKTVMLEDRMFDRVVNKDFVVMDEMTKWNIEKRNANWKKHLADAYQLGYTF